MIFPPGGNTRSGGLERSCAAARGTTPVTTRAVPTATGITPTTATTIWGSVWCCVLPMFFRPFFWFRHPAGRRTGTPVPAAFRQCRPTRASGFTCRGEGRRTAPDRSGPRARRKAGRGAGHRPRRAHSEAGARPGQSWPAVPRPAHLSSGSPRRPGPAASAARVCLIQPPNSLPMPITMRLTCSYWPALSHCHRFDRRK